MIALDRITGGNPEAKSCIEVWGECLRAVDNIVDNGTYDVDSILNATALNIRFCSHPFYRRHINHLQMPALIATGLWEVSVDWEKRSELWKRQWADVLRHADAVFLGAVCLICVGWDKARDFYPAFLSAGYVDHLDRYGTPK